MAEDRISHDIDALFNLIRENDKMQNQRHTEVCSRLTAIEKTMPQQPCPDTKQLRKEFDSHILNHVEYQKNWSGVAFRVVAALLVASIIGIAGYSIIGFVHKLKSQETNNASQR